MDSGLYAAYTGLMARTQALDTAANNLANVGTNGFRAQRDHFAGVIAASLDQQVDTGSQVGQSVNGFSVLGGTTLDLGQGQLTSTGNPLDLAIHGLGFFAVQTAKGIRYTRDGQFTRSNTGVLQNNCGESVLDTNFKPISIPTGDVDIAADGNISVAMPDGSAIAGKLGVFDFTDKSVLTAEGSNQFGIGANIKPTPSNATLQQGAIEAGNEDAVHGAMKLVLVQRQAEMMQKALSVFNNDFDKTATEDLPRV
jgi:flagellar basal-body rod protein FlgF